MFGFQAAISAGAMVAILGIHIVNAGNSAAPAFGEAGFPSVPIGEIGSKIDEWAKRFKGLLRNVYDFRDIRTVNRDWSALTIQLRNELRKAELDAGIDDPGPGYYGPDPVEFGRDPAPRIEGEWSAPMTKAEMARRITGNRKARAREVEAILVSYGIKNLSGNKWSVRLDGMDSNTRKKIETPN